MFRSILKAFRRESWNCNDRYGVTPETLLATALELISDGGLLEVSYEDVGVIPMEYSRSRDHKGIISPKGESFRISPDFSARFGDDLKNSRVTVPDIYCLIESEEALLSVVSRYEIIDYSPPFLKLLETRLTRAS